MELYHETQCRQQCLLHTVNNLLQEATFAAADLDRLADSLAPGKLPLPLLHPHRTLFLGNWDVSVLEMAVESAGKSLKWHDQRDNEFTNTPALTTCFGLVVNVKSPGRLAALLDTRHWFAVRKLKGVWYNLDSKLPEPKRIRKLVEEEIVAAAGDDGDSGRKDVVAAMSAALEDDEEEDTALRMFLTNLQNKYDAKVFLII